MRKKYFSLLLVLAVFLAHCTGGSDSTGATRGNPMSDMYRDLIGMFQQPPTFVSIGTELRISTKGAFSYNSGITASDTASWSTGWEVNTKLPTSSITQALLYADTLSSGGNTEVDMSISPELRIYDQEGNRLNGASGSPGGWGSGSYPHNLLPYLNQKVTPVLTYFLTDGRHAYTIYPSVYITTTD